MKNLFSKLWLLSVLMTLIIPQAEAGSLCAADVNRDGLVDVLDLQAVQAQWQMPCTNCAEDIDRNRQVSVIDCILAINAAGEECPLLSSTELAGRSLPDFPYFDYVLAFNQGTDVEVGIDTTQFPQFNGQTVDFYVVEAKTFEAWIADTSLVDVTGDGPQTEMLAPDSLQNNRFTLSGSANLNADAGSGIGRAYDVVLDANQNGVYDRGDLIDGLGDPLEFLDRRDGFYMVHDLTLPGPHAVTSVEYVPTDGSVTPGFRNQVIFYPSAISSMGELPLVVISHGNGHNYQWYDHLGNHLASYGYIVMSHANNTIPGVVTASTTTLEHTDAFLGQLGLINGGVLQGHVDDQTIVWIGHSRGGEGVAIGVDRLFKGDFVPQNYDLGDIVLVSSIAPVDFRGPNQTNPQAKVFHLWTGGADADVNGCAGSEATETFHLHDRAKDYRQSISLYGVGHGAFHNGGGSLVATGPCIVSRADTHQIMKGYLLPLAKHYTEGNIPARDFLWRQWEQLKPIGAPDDPCVVVNLMYREGETSLFRMVDDFQGEVNPNVSSEGQTVSFDVTDLTEGRFDDSNASFTHDPNDPMNGVTLGNALDTTSGLVFSFDTDRFYQVDVPPDMGDFTQWRYLSFRAAQGTRHPLTTAALEDLTFDVVLVDETGQRSAVNIGVYGGGIEEPYQRGNCGQGQGWANEFETIRMRIIDFVAENSGIDLTQIETIRFEFGPSHGSSEGRIALDEIALSKDAPAFPADKRLNIQFDGEVPEIIGANQSLDVAVVITSNLEMLIENSALLKYRINGAPEVSMPLTPLGNHRFQATLPALNCGDAFEYYFSAEGSKTGVVTFPADIGSGGLQPAIGTRTQFFEETMDTDPNWSTQGEWAFGQNTGGGGSSGPPDPTSAATGDTLYGYNLNGDYSNNLPETHLTTQAIDCSGREQIELRFMRFLGVEQSIFDRATVSVSNDGTNFTAVWQNTGTVADTQWEEIALDISAIADNQSTVFIRWTMGPTDTAVVFCGWNIDDVTLSGASCP